MKTVPMIADLCARSEGRPDAPTEAVNLELSYSSPFVNGILFAKECRPLIRKWDFFPPLAG